MFIMCNMSCRQRIHRTCEDILCGHVSKRIVRGEGERKKVVRGGCVVFPGGVCLDLLLFQSFFWKLQAFAYVQQFTTKSQFPKTFNHIRKKLQDVGVGFKKCRKSSVVVFNHILLEFCPGKHFVITYVRYMYVCVIETLVDSTWWMNAGGLCACDSGTGAKMVGQGPGQGQKFRTPMN